MAYTLLNACAAITLALPTALPAAPQSGELQRATGEIRQGQLEKAESTLRGARQARPDSVAVNQLLGVVLEREEKFQEAEQVLKQAWRLSGGKNPQILLALCQAEFALKRKPEAQSLATQVLALAGDNPQLYYGVGRLLRDNGLAEPALPQLVEAHSLAPGDPAVTSELIVASLDTGHQRQADALLVSFIAAASYEDLLNAGARFGETGKYGAAVRALERALQLKPDGRDAAFNLALAYLHHGAPDRALAALDSVPAPPVSDPADDRADYCYLRAKIAAALHRDDKAGEAFLQALAIEPDNDSLCSDAGLFFFRFGDFWKALDVYRKCSERLPDSAPVATGLGLTYFRLGKYDDATRSFTSVLALRPDSDAAREALVFLDYVSGQLPAAQKLIEDRLRTWGADYYLYYLEGLVLSRLDPRESREKAIDALNQAIRLNPTFAPAYFQRAKIWEQAHDSWRALSDLDRATRLDSTYAEPFYLMAQIDYRLGRRQDAARAQREYSLRERDREEKEQHQLVENRLLQAIQ